MSDSDNFLPSWNVLKRDDTSFMFDKKGLNRYKLRLTVALFTENQGYNFQFSAN
jgi:hypothetical protein